MYLSLKDLILSNIIILLYKYHIGHFCKIFVLDLILDHPHRISVVSHPPAAPSDSPTTSLYSASRRRRFSAPPLPSATSLQLLTKPHKNPHSNKMHGRPRKPLKEEDESVLSAKAEKLLSLQSQFLANHQNRMYVCFFILLFSFA